MITMRFVLLLTIILITACSKAPESTSIPSQQQDVRAADPPAVGRYVNMEDPLIKEYIVSGVVPAHAEAQWRWTQANPTFRFKLKKLENMRFHADFTINPTALTATGPVTIIWLINGHELAKETHAKEGFKKLEKAVPAEWLKSDVDNIVSATIDKIYTSPEGEKYGFIISNLGFID